MKRIYLLFLFSLIFAGCATMQTIDVSNRQHTYDKAYLDVFRAAVDYCNQESFAITQMDKELGVINTDFKENDGTSKFFLGNRRVKLNFSLRSINETSTKVIAIISAEEQGAFGSWEQTTMTEGEAIDYYNKVFDGIQHMLNN